LIKSFGGIPQTRFQDCTEIDVPGVFANHKVKKDMGQMGDVNFD
jgi:hypothetical protein